MGNRPTPEEEHSCLSLMLADFYAELIRGMFSGSLKRRHLRMVWQHSHRADGTLDICVSKIRRFADKDELLLALAASHGVSRATYFALRPGDLQPLAKAAYIEGRPHVLLARYEPAAARRDYTDYMARAVGHLFRGGRR